MSERSAVQNPMIRYAEEIGWTYIPSKDALQKRGGDAGLYLTDELEAQLMRLNPNVVNAERAEDILRLLNLLNPSLEGNRDALSWLRGEQSVYDTNENRERNVHLIDFDNLENNVFHVTDEWPQKGTAFRNRADVVFLINGIPVAVIETKAAGKRDGLAIGMDQIRRYHRETPEMFVTSQLYGVTQLMDFFYSVTWNTSRKNLFNWKTEQPGNYEHTVKTFFDRSRFLDVLHDDIIFLTKDDELSKVVLRQHQTRAVRKVIDRVKDSSMRRGLIWHTQGSGKTLTMITIASKLLRESGEGEEPTGGMLIDRNELESQLFKNITSYGITNPKVASSKRNLRQILASDYRGLVVSMIHKFDDIPENINTRNNIIILVDEAHRTTGGDFGNYLMAALPNATYIGFTGTPIDKLSHGKGTFKVFGADDEQGYLDKYSIAESIEDGTTVQLNYALAPSELLVDRETLEKEFLSLVVSEGVSDLEELNAILNKAVRLKEVMKAPDLVDKKASYIANHYRENVEPMGFKAFVVGVDREACSLYKEALDRYLPSEYSQVVYSPHHQDSAALKAHHLDEDKEKEIRRNFVLKDNQPKILIVTQKLLTGFDAPVLYCMYLDKPMRDHVLLQAIARVNRPYEDGGGLVKPYGFVFDFVGLFENLERVLAFDSDVVASVIKNIDVLKSLFETMMKETAPQYLPLTEGWDDKAKEQAIEYFSDKQKQEPFFKFFRQLQNLYDILSPDAFLRPFIDDYQAIAELYRLIREAYTDRIYIDKELTAKTRELLHRHTASGAFDLPGAVHELGPEELAAIKRGTISDNLKVLNLRKVLSTKVVEEGTSKPFLISIGDRAEAVAQRYENRQMTTEQALAEFERLAQEYVDAAKDREQMRVDENTFAIYTVLKTFVEDVAKNKAAEINEIFMQFPDYQWNEQQGSRLRTELYKALRPIVGASKLIQVTNTLLKLQRV